MNKGYIKLPRSEKDYFSAKKERATYYQAWVDLLQMAAYKDKPYNDTIIKRGEILTSVRALSDLWLWSKDKVGKFLKQLECDKKIIIVSTDRLKGTRIKILNIERYQGESDSDSETQSDTLKPVFSRANSNCKDTHGHEQGHEIGHLKASNNKACEDFNGHESGHKQGHTKNIKEYKSVYIEPTSENGKFFTESEYERLVSEYGQEETDGRIREMKNWEMERKTKIDNPSKLFRQWNRQHKPKANTKPIVTTGKAKNNFNNFQQRETDFTILEQKLLAPYH